MKARQHPDVVVGLWVVQAYAARLPFGLAQGAVPQQWQLVDAALTEPTALGGLALGRAFFVLVLLFVLFPFDLFLLLATAALLIPNPHTHTNIEPRSAVVPRHLQKTEGGALLNADAIRTQRNVLVQERSITAIAGYADGLGRALDYQFVTAAGAVGVAARHLNGVGFK